MSKLVFGNKFLKVLLKTPIAFSTTLLFQQVCLLCIAFEIF
jgi:hypothetical protein